MWVALKAALLLVWPFVLVVDALLRVLGFYYRRKCDTFRSAWPHKTVPHLRSTNLARKADLTNWRLTCFEGRQVWTVEDDRLKARPQNFVEKYNLGLAPHEPISVRDTAKSAMRDAAIFLCKLQDEDGHWPNDYSGPMFLTPGLVIVKYVTNGGDHDKMFKHCPQQRPELIRYIVNYQNEDGGWGTHTESHSTMFGSVLNYVAMRLLGEPADSDSAARGRNWILSRGGAVSVPSWGKMWLCIAGLYEYSGVDSIPPEMILLPKGFILSMGNLWCQNRLVALPMSYLYGKRWKGPLTPLIAELRKEMYVEPYTSIQWSKQRHNIFTADLCTPHSSLYDGLAWVLQQYEKLPFKSYLRAKALEVCYDHCRYDDETTEYICIGPVNKSLNMLLAFIEEGAESERFKCHLARVDDYLFMGPEGMRMSGYNGSQLWDTSFAVQAICAAGLEEELMPTMEAAHKYLDVAQVVEDPPGDFEKYFRHRTKGAWNFSTRSQGWQVSDCTAEGLRAVLLLQDTVKVPFPPQRIFDAVDEILSLRSTKLGGWASYEPPRAPTYLELLNSSEVFKDIMVDYIYPECTSSCIHTLCLFREQHPTYRSQAVSIAIKEGVRCVLNMQRRDGSYYGSWASCFTYGGWIVSDALQMAGVTEGDPVFKLLSAFTLGHQNADGGWGEDFNSCVTGEYVVNPDGSQVIHTAWAVMTLMCCHHSTPSDKVVRAVQSGVAFIMGRQLRSGDWAQERISGVFNGNCAIHYPGYKNTMPLWALGKYATWRHNMNNNNNNNNNIIVPK